MGRILRSLGAVFTFGAATIFGIRSLTAGGEEVDDDDEVDMVAVLTTRQVRSLSESFMGADVTAVAGSAALDLRQAEMGPTGAEIRIGGLGGVVRLTIPSHWRTEISSASWLGTTTDKTASVVDSDAPVLRVRSDLNAGRVIINALPQLKAVG